jgi:hypothetical protein
MTLDELSIDELRKYSSKDGPMSVEDATSLFDLIHQGDRIRKAFEMNDVECEAANAFAEKHGVCKAHPIGGSKFSYIFTPTIGMNVHIKCLICGEEKDISDFQQLPPKDRRLQLRIT